MRKLWIMLSAVLLTMPLISCAADTKGDIVLPAAEEIVEVNVTNGDSPKSVSKDTDYIKKLIEEMSKAKDTGKQSIYDNPNGDRELKIEMKTSDGNISTVYMYYEKNDLLLEKPYQGIYKTDKSLYQFVNECK